MKKIIKKIIRYLLIPFVYLDYLKFRKLDEKPRFTIALRDFFPQIKDRTVKTEVDYHYICHTAWAARKVEEINPIKHVDISSSLYFCGILSAFVPVEFYDLRPATLRLSNLQSNQTNLLRLTFADESVQSLSCLHTVEHIGLGRYGDKIDPDGDIKAINELKRVLTKNGSLLFVVPVGRARIEFDAHRIYSYDQVTEYFKDLELKEFTLITDSGEIIEMAESALVDKQEYGCGCFWFIKK